MGTDSISDSRINDAERGNEKNTTALTSSAQNKQRDTDSKPGVAKKVLLAPLVGIHAGLEHLLGYKKSVTREEEILEMVDESSEQGLIEDSSAEIINNVFEFTDLKVADVMTHRVDVVGVGVDSALEDVVSIARESGFSRMPVYRENIDNVIGILMVKDLLRYIGENEFEFSLEALQRNAIYVPESCSCSGLLKTLREKKTGMAIIVDEYGGTAGVVTMEDLIEEIMGSILDEYDKEEEAEFKDVGNGKYTIDGDSDPEDALALFGHSLPEDHEYETVAGFVTDLLGFVPEQCKVRSGQRPQADYNGVRFIVTAVEDNCISRVVAFAVEGSHYEKTA